MILDGRRVGEIRPRFYREFDVFPGEHEIYVTFLKIRWSQVLEFSIEPGHDSAFVCRTGWHGFPQLRQAEPRDDAAIRKAALAVDPPLIEL